MADKSWATNHRIASQGRDINGRHKSEFDRQCLGRDRKYRHFDSAAELVSATLSEDYKRQIDLWIKLCVIVTPIISAAVSWGVIKTTINSLEIRMNRIEQWVENETKISLQSATLAASAAEVQRETNRRLERIEVILDSRLKVR